MSKNQINFLLGLATFMVIWFYFNTFFMGAMIQKKMVAHGGASDQMPGPAMDLRNFQGFSNPYGNRPSYMNQNQQPGFPYGNRPPSFSPPSAEEIQKMLEAQRSKEVPSGAKKP